MKFTVWPRYSCLVSILAIVDVLQMNRSSRSCWAETLIPFLFPWAAGFSIFLFVSSVAICVGPSPFIQRWKISFTTVAASSSIIQCSLSCGSFTYPYGGLVQSGLPDSPFALNTALIFLLVSLAYHSLMIFRNGVKSLSCWLALSTPLLIAMKRTSASGNATSV